MLIVKCCSTVSIFSLDFILRFNEIYMCCSNWFFFPFSFSIVLVLLITYSVCLYYMVAWIWRNIILLMSAQANSNRSRTLDECVGFMNQKHNSRYNVKKKRIQQEHITFFITRLLLFIHSNASLRFTNLFMQCIIHWQVWNDWMTI